ncbi:MAG: phosphosulfolactate synthase [Methanobacteriaceae archaeon]|nr:phosphosulfolactate synthase [Methanobacteriaceae archaeon]
MKAFNFLLKDTKGKSNTMVLDKGQGYQTTKDMLEITGDYFNLLKYGWGTSTLYKRDIIKDKNELYHQYDIKTYPGGTLFEIANKQDKIDEYLQEADKLGFNAIEISDGSTYISLEKRQEAITKVKEQGFYLLTEVGKKDLKKDSELKSEDRVKLIQTDLDNKSDLVIVEARESGKNIGIFDEKGNIKEDDFETINKNIPQNKILWEAPQKNQQIDLILKLGADVNLGNINVNDIISLETLRRGLRGDTLGKV